MGPHNSQVTLSQEVHHWQHKEHQGMGHQGNPTQGFLVSLLFDQRRMQQWHCFTWQWWSCQRPMMNNGQQGWQHQCPQPWKYCAWGKTYAPCWSGTTHLHCHCLCQDDLFLLLAECNLFWTLVLALVRQASCGARHGHGKHHSDNVRPTILLLPQSLTSTMILSHGALWCDRCMWTSLTDIQGVSRTKEFTPGWCCCG